MRKRRHFSNVPQQISREPGVENKSVAAWVQAINHYSVLSKASWYLSCCFLLAWACIWIWLSLNSFVQRASHILISHNYKSRISVSDIFLEGVYFQPSQESRHLIPSGLIFWFPLPTSVDSPSEFYLRVSMPSTFAKVFKKYQYSWRLTYL